MNRQAARLAVAIPRPGRRLWRLIVGPLVAFALAFFGMAIVIQGGAPYVGRTVVETAFFWFDYRQWTPETRAAAFLGTAWILIAVGTGWLAAMIAAWGIQRRSVGSLLGRRGVDPRAFVRAALGWAAALGVGVMIFLIAGTGLYRWQADLGYALAGLLLLPFWLVQTGAEEVVFRGLLLQSMLAVRMRVWLAILLQAGLFGALHYDASVLQGDVWFTVAYTTILGVIAGIATVRTGNLGAAWGLHLANNLMVYHIAAPADGMHEAALVAYSHTRWHEVLDPAQPLGLDWAYVGGASGMLALTVGLGAAALFWRRSPFRV